MLGDLVELLDVRALVSVVDAHAHPRPRKQHLAVGSMHNIAGAQLQDARVPGSLRPEPHASKQTA